MSDQDPAIIRTFAATVAALEDGQLNHSLTEQQRDIIAAIHEAGALNGGKARAELTLKVKYMIEGGLIEVTAEIKAKVPELKRGRSLLYATPENNLTQRNPRQPEFAFRDVAMPVPRNLA